MRWLTWTRILSAVGASYPGRGLRGVSCRSRFLWSLARERTTLRPWFEEEEREPVRGRIDRDPELLGFGVWPFLHAGWPIDARYAALLEHDRTVALECPSLSIGKDDRWLILPLPSQVPGLRLELDRSSWFFREGSLVFNLSSDEDRLMSIAFSLARVGDALTAYVGAIQGTGRPGAVDLYRQLTHEQEGLRTRDFTFKTFQLFAHAIGVRRILCVGNEARHQHHPYFREHAVAALFLDYDEVWIENGGRPLPSGFFELPAIPSMRPVSEAPVRKRAMYRRRRALLERLGGQIQAAVSARAGSAPDA